MTPNSVAIASFLQLRGEMSVFCSIVFGGEHRSTWLLFSLLCIVLGRRLPYQGLIVMVTHLAYPQPTYRNCVFLVLVRIGC